MLKKSLGEIIEKLQPYKSVKILKIWEYIILFSQ